MFLSRFLNAWNVTKNCYFFLIHLLILTLCQCRVSSDPVFLLHHSPAVFSGNWSVFPTKIHPGFPATPGFINSRVLMGFLGQGPRVAQRGLEWEQLDTHSCSYTQKSVLWNVSTFAMRNLISFHFSHVAPPVRDLTPTEHSTSYKMGAITNLALMQKVHQDSTPQKLVP